MLKSQNQFAFKRVEVMQVLKSVSQPQVCGSFVKVDSLLRRLSILLVASEDH